jgi:hypothetical protein
MTAFEIEARKAKIHAQHRRMGHAVLCLGDWGG